MASLCNSKSPKPCLINNLNDNSYKKCRFKLEYPPILESNDFYLGVKQPPIERNSRLGNVFKTQTPTPKKKLKFQCHYEERKRRAELRRKRIIQKLKKVYNIDVEGMNEHLTREIILKTEMIEKEEKERERRKAERSMIMISRLLEDQKYKHRGSKLYHVSWKKPVKKAKPTEKEEKIDNKMCFGDTGEQSITWNEKAERQSGSLLGETIRPQTAVSKELSEEYGEKSVKEEKIASFPECIETKKSEDILQFHLDDKLRALPKPPLERCLESTPRKIVFQDYEKNRVYLQDLKITNVSCDTIHCRYLGIVVHTKTEERFPVGVAVRDNVKIRPGLSCSTKIRLCSQNDTKRLECSIVYETRRRKNILQHSWFLVPVECIPVQALVKVSPLKIMFPVLSWCEATGINGTKLLRKSLKIENSGGKACSCSISTTSIENDEEGESIEGEGEVQSVIYRRESVNDNKSQSTISIPSENIEEYNGEAVPYYEEAEETSKYLIDELIGNAFGPFRFAQKYHIEIPPFSIVFIQVTFIPHYKGFHQERYFIKFEACDNCKEQTIELMGYVKKLPLRAEPQVIDLKTCIANSGVYSGPFRIFNDSKGPHWVIVKLPASVKKHAHVYPRATVILPFSFSDFSVKIYPRVTLARDAPRYYDVDSQIFEFPIFIHPANIGSCRREFIKIYVMALITDYCLQLSPSIINFGIVSTLETVRTELELTNHSLASQEYGFLNLPKGVRVEPNMGFGTILPKESIILHLLYSPEDEFLECESEKNHDFQVIVTSIAKYGGFKEKLEPYEESFKTFEILWGEDHVLGETPPEPTAYNTTNNSIKTPLSEYQMEEEEFDECEETSSIEGEELCLKIYEQENKIREFLKQDLEDSSELFKTGSLQEDKPERPSRVQFQGENFIGDSEEYEDSRGICGLKKDIHIVNCHAIVVKPSCQLSDSIIQLPATPFSSFSLYRFRLTCAGKKDDGDCICGFRKTPEEKKKSEEESNSQVSFEFQHSYPHIKLEPESGIIKHGHSIPITVIFRPELSGDQGLEIKTAERSSTGIKSGTELTSQTSSWTKSKGKGGSPSLKSSSNPIEDVMKTASRDLRNSDHFEERGIVKLINPFVEQTKIQCVVKTRRCSDMSEKTEIHEMVFICPVINPKFIYLGTCQEINFDKVFIGTKSKIIFQIQNISFERISPSVTLLNPLGSFYCSAGVRNVEVDPEHIWRQPLVFAPLSQNGIEKQYFEIYCGPTNVFLTVSGEGIEPSFKITPNFTCCLFESKPGSTEELKLEVENLSTVKLNVYVQTNFVKMIPDVGNIENEVEEDTKVKKEKTNQTDDVKDKKKTRKSDIQLCKFWEEIPEAILSSVESDNAVDEPLEMFSFTGVNENNAFAVLPSEKQQIRILFTPPPDKSDGFYAVQYGLMLERVSLLKEMLVIGKIVPGK